MPPPSLSSRLSGFFFSMNNLVVHGQSTPLSRSPGPPPYSPDQRAETSVPNDLSDNASARDHIEHDGVGYAPAPLSPHGRGHRELPNPPNPVTIHGYPDAQQGTLETPLSAHIRNYGDPNRRAPHEPGPLGPRNHSPRALSDVEASRGSPSTRHSINSESADGDLPEQIGSSSTIGTSITPLLQLEPEHNVYYKMWSPTGRQIPTRNPMTQNTPLLGFIPAGSVRPPHTVGMLKQCILRAEEIDTSTTCELFVNTRTNDLAVDDSSFLLIFEDGPGCQPNTPIGLVISVPTPEATPTFRTANLSEPTFSTVTHTVPPAPEPFNIRIRARQDGLYSPDNSQFLDFKAGDEFWTNGKTYMTALRRCIGRGDQKFRVYQAIDIGRVGPVKYIMKAAVERVEADAAHGRRWGLFQNFYSNRS